MREFWRCSFEFSNRFSADFFQQYAMPIDALVSSSACPHYLLIRIIVHSVRHGRRVPRPANLQIRFA
jgi:hypothetical protein